MAEVESLELKISSDSKSAAKGIDALTQSLQKLKDATGGLGLSSVSKGIEGVDTSVKKTSSSVAGLSASNKKASSSFTDLYHKFGMVKSVVTGVYNIISPLVKKSTEYNEVVNLFSVAMGEYATEAAEYANKVSNIMGIDPAEWMRNQGLFMTLATGFGIASDSASTMSENLTQLGYDIASFQNISVGQAMQKLQSGLAGELEPLRRIGYDLSVAKLEEMAKEMNLDKTVSEMTQAEKAQLRYIAIIDQVKQHQGDMARTLENPANQLRILKAQFEITARSIGNIFVPALEAILPYAVAVTKVVGELAQSLAELVGYEAPEIGADGVSAVSVAAEGANEALAEGQENAKKLKSYMLGFDELNVINPNGGAGDEASSALDLAVPTYDFLKGASSEKVDGIVTEIKESLAGVKEILDSIMESEALTGIVDLFTKWGEQFGNLNVGESALSVLQNTLSVIGSVMSLILPILTNVVDKLNIPQLVVDTLNLIGTALQTIKDVVDSLSPGITAYYEAFYPIIEWLGGVASDTLRLVGELLNTIGGVFTTNEPAFSGILESLGKIVGVIWQLIEPLLSAVWDNTIKFIGELLTAISPVITKLMELASTIMVDLGDAFAKLGDILKPLTEFVEGAVGDAFNKLLAPAMKDLCEKVLPPLIDTFKRWWQEVLVPLIDLIEAVLTPVITILSEVMGMLWENYVLPLGNALWEVLVAAFEGVVEILNKTVIPIVKEVVKELKILWEKVLSPIVNFLWDIWKPAFEEVFKAIKGVIDGFKKAIVGIIDFITGVFTGDWERAWEGIKKIFSGVFEGLSKLVNAPLNAIIAVLEGFANKVIDAWNWIKKGINSLSIDVPEWLGGGTIGFDLEMSDHIKIPRFADGGFPEHGQLFVAREAGAEMVGNIGRRTAVANNDQIVSGIAGGVAEANEEQNTLLREQNSLLRALLEKDNRTYLDGKALTQSVEKYQRERGRVIVTGGVM